MYATDSDNLLVDEHVFTLKWKWIYYGKSLRWHVIGYVIKSEMTLYEILTRHFRTKTRASYSDRIFRAEYKFYKLDRGKSHYINDISGLKLVSSGLCE